MNVYHYYKLEKYFMKNSVENTKIKTESKR